MLSSNAVDTILERLGGQKMLDAIGAHNIVADNARVSFTLRANPARVHTVAISRQPTGRYRIDCYGRCAPGTFQATHLGAEVGVTADNLADKLGEMTGLQPLRDRHF